MSDSMVVTVRILENTFTIASPGHDISIPLNFYGEQPNAFLLPRARAKAARTGVLAGSTRKGGGCNCETITLTPHGNGTHTESIGHLTHHAVPVEPPNRLVPATLVTVTPERALECGDECERTAGPGDRVISRRLLAERFRAARREFLDAAVIRTLPNGEEKKTMRYSGKNPPYLTVEAADYLKHLGVRHLLVDLPSVDREEDGGALRAHRVFWDLPPRSFDLPRSYSRRTITEMVYAADAVPDGEYCLDLQLPPFLLHAIPSRPVLFPVVPV